jgi:diguanylate cyclase (GGDEF)-like protein/PAS domain S-box-containing protein
VASAGSDLVRALLVEDDEDDYLIARDLLAAQNRTRFEVDWCAGYEQALPVIAERRHDVYLIDYQLGRETGLGLIRDAFKGGDPAPVIMLTGHAYDHDIDLEAAELGVTDFLSKGQLDATLLERSIRYAISHNRAIVELRESRERYELAVEGAHDGIWDWDLVADRIYLGRRWKEILGCTDADIVGDSSGVWLDRIHPEDIAGVRSLVDAHLAGHSEYFQSEHRIRHYDDSYRWVLNRGVAVRDGEGRPTRMAGSMSDISDRKTAEQQLRHDALHDALTGLPNRTLFLDRLGVALRRASRTPMSHAVLFIDVDRFKLINDGFSHAVGDELLMAIARRLEANLRPGDTVARLGGDEFTVLLEGVEGVEGAVTTAERINALLREPFRVAGQELGISASIGIAVSEVRSQAVELMRNADIAMYDAKLHPNPAVAVFDVSMRSRVVAQLQVETALRKVVEEGALGIAYQPIVDVATRRIAGFEALARWPEGGDDISPAEFIPVAEDTGLIRQLGKFVLEQACGQLAGWRRAHLVADTVTMSVNVSGRQLADPDFPDVVREVLEQNELPGEALQVELTESTVIDAPDQIRDALGKLEQLGVRAQLDDFGTGFSSLTFLHHFPLDAIKIDRSFVASMHTDSSKEEIVSAIIKLAHSLRLGVIAEGVEEAAQLSILEAVGCEYAQGYLFAKPVYPAGIEEMLGASDLMTTASAL